MFNNILIHCADCRSHKLRVLCGESNDSVCFRLDRIAFHLIWNVFHDHFRHNTYSESMRNHRYHGKIIYNMILGMYIQSTSFQKVLYICICRLPLRYKRIRLHLVNPNVFTIAVPLHILGHNAQQRIFVQWDNGEVTCT